MAKKKESNKEKAAKAIARLWGGIEDDQFDLLLEHIELTKFKKGELIYKNEEHPAKAMCLLTGKVKIFKDGISGKNQIIRVIKPLEFFGFRAYFADEIYKTAAMSLDNCVVAQFPFAVLMKMLQKSFNIGHYFIKYLSIEIGKSDDRTVNLPKAHPCPPCRSSSLPARFLRTGQRWLHAGLQSEPRRPGKHCKYDDQQLHPHPFFLCN